MRQVVFILLAVCAVGCTAAPDRETGPSQVTVPLLVEGNRPLVDVDLRRTDGTTRSARFLVDSGGGGFLLVEPLARELGCRWGEVRREEGSAFATIDNPPPASVGTFPLTLDPDRVTVMLGVQSILPPAAVVRAEGMFPGHLLARYHVVLDYPGGTFTLARAGVLTPRGEALPMPVSEGHGFPRTELEVDGTRYGFLIDSGASFTMVSEVLLKTLGERHADWPRQPGAAGEAATLGGTTLETMVVPRARWGTLELAQLGWVSQRQGTFERYMSSMMTAPIVGSLAGNVLKQFRVELDYANEKLYLSRP
ncbi:MAG TPA: aspartyl protease family protein [Candidatus Polarisedimenticolaceae bacterium]|nr:aspartyl protease family protein [Candidatus Polarisedimenticolaceae bacterium]